MILAPQVPLLRGQDARFQSSFWRTKAKVVLPFESIHGEIVIQLSLNGAPPANFLLDSGAGMTQLDRRAIETAHLKTFSVNSQALTPAGKFSFTLAAQDVHLRRNKDELLHGSVFATDLSQLEESCGVPLAGVIGFDYIQQYPILLDYSAKTITIFADKEVQYRGPGIIVHAENMQPSGESIDFPAVIAHLELNNGSRVSARLEIDTGSDHALTLHAPFARQHDVAQQESNRGPKAAPILSETFDGARYQLVRGQISAIRIGNLRIADPGVLYAKEAVGLSASDQTDGELGNKFLSRFRIFFDIPRGLIVFEPSLDQ